jgi:hypothetical protein
MAVATPPKVLLGALLACLAYAAFARGAIELPLETWLQLALLVIAAATAAGALYGRSLRIAAPPLAWVALGLLAAFAAWTGLTILWSVAPDQSWASLNRAIAYVLALALGLVVGSSLRRAPESAGKGFVIVASLVALYALAAKTVPAFSPVGLDLDHAEALARLRAPLGYWNALGLVCALAAPFALRLAADPAQRVRTRLAGLGALYLLLVVLGFTYSRGGILGFLAGTAVVLALGTERLRSLALLAVTGFAALFPLLLGFSQPDLSGNGIPLDRRTDDALVVLLVFLGCGAALLAAGRGLIAVERSGRVTPERARTARRVVFGGMAVIGVLAFLQVVASGTLGSLADDFTATKGDRISDPSRLLTTNSGNRWSWWKEAAGAFSDEPVAGWGAGSFRVTHRLYRRDGLGVLQPHSVPLQFLAETGLVGLLLGLGALLALLAAALGRSRRARGYGLAAAAAGVTWLVHAAFDWDWDIPGVTIPVLVLLGVAAARPAGPEPVFSRREGAGRAPVLAAALTLIALAMVSAALPPLADHYRREAISASSVRGASPATVREAAADAEFAARLNPLAAAPLFVSAAIAENRGSFAEARRILLRALDREPDSVEGWVRLARVLAALKDPGGSERAARKALALDPVSTNVLIAADAILAAQTPPELSASATGSPLPEVVPVTDPRPPLDEG